VKTIVILISGRGSNLQALIEAAEREAWAARIVAVVSSRADAAGLEIAKSAGIATEVVDAPSFGERSEFDAALLQVLARLAPDLVLLAGFMRILPDKLVRAYAGRILNIHPSLLPAFNGLYTHRQALEAGVRVHGATVHFVTAELDRGPIVAQAQVPVFPEDSAAVLEQRVLEQEHRLYPRVVRWIIEGKVELVEGRLRMTVDPAELVMPWPR
jgi:phosphoribosylglycinamide formyltransferase-1